MDLQFGRAVTADEIAEVQRLRYLVYVEELGRYRGAADEVSGRLAEPEDEYGWLAHHLHTAGTSTYATATTSFRRLG